METRLYKQTLVLAGSLESQLNLDFAENQAAKGVTGEGLTPHNIPCDDWWIAFSYYCSGKKVDIVAATARVNPIKEGNLYRLEICIEATFREVNSDPFIEFSENYIYLFFENKDSDGTTLGNIPLVNPPLPTYALNSDIMPVFTLPLQIREGNLSITKNLTIVCLNFQQPI